MEADASASLRQITERLEALAAELDSEKDEERAAELVREASKLAAEAGEEAERALRQGAQAPESEAGPGGGAAAG